MSLSSSSLESGAMVGDEGGVVGGDGGVGGVDC
eukprot:CAMPEP_0201543888 /NCGR_PEP_ID=MMETSP0161_2-20130828/72859_1 /ASSEMBLY_ACC=CAM_ASM_000251 /TAXON_ID=180227 /ORGANISM="Neoparamoeba aestuarina, Strain SoJaBio B1-5/56/2" /LENGTH=32 /DNA_ID= /DNA_START= /DNA_END= /DNA_ORIENTATION=